MDKVKRKYSGKVPTRTLFCGHCGVVVTVIRNLKLHGSWEYEGHEYKCRPCGKVVMAGTKLELHKMQTHKNLFKWAQLCGPRGIVSRNRRSMELHATRVHKGQSIKCRLCGKGMRIRAKLKNLGIGVHIRTSSDLHICEVRVVRRVGTKALVMERLTNGSGRKEDFKCDLCGVDACEPANLKQHKGGWCWLKFFKCDPCGLVFKVGKHLKSGIQECDSFGTAKEVLDDIVEVTLAVSCEVAKVDVSLTPLAMIRIDEPRTHDLFTVKPEKFSSLQCDTCGLAVRVSNDLKEHKMGELGNVKVSSVVNSEVAKVDVSLTPLAIIRID